jgi:hypothetical protein
MRNPNKIQVLLFLTTLLCCCCAGVTTGQKSITVDNGCNFSNAADPTTITYLDPTPEAKRITAEILKAAGGYQQSFHLVVGNVKNARASFKDVRYIFYSQQFMENFSNQSRTRWAAYFLLAHEIGHHVLNHNFKEKTKEKRHQNEFQADTFATRVLFRLGARYDEVMAGIKTFDDEGESESHPDADARAEFIAVTYKQLAAKFRPEEETSTAAPSAAIRSTPLALDNSCFQYSENLIKNATAEIDGEKIVIKFNIPDQYRSTRFKVCLLSNDATIRPESRTPGSLGGTGVGINYAPTMSVVWNYRMDRYTQNEAGKPNLLRIYVFDMYNLPKNNAIGPIMGCTAIGVVGMGTSIWGVISMSDGKSIYDNTYRQTRLDDDFDRADKKYVRGQYLIGGGVVLVGVGAWLLIRHLKENKKAQKAVCAIPVKKIHIEPMIADRVGFLMRF